jgi:hypothetical protein
MQSGHLLIIDCCNMLSVCIVERWKASFVTLALKLGLHPSNLAHLSNSSSNLLKLVPLGPWIAMRALPCNRLL